MILTVKKSSQEKDLNSLIKQLEAKGLQINYSQGIDHIVIGLVGDTSSVDEDWLRSFEFVEAVTRVAAPYKKANRLFHPEDSIIDVNGIKIGGNQPIVIIGGPCAVEDEDQINRIAQEVKDGGAKMLRGGAYKPRTSPYSFQGLGTKGIEYMCEAREKTGLPIVSELMSVDKIDEFVKNVDIIQIGARNMQNFDLLKAVGKTNKPILLKRGLSATIEEWIMSAEYIMSQGNPNVIFCERGIRTFEKYTRNTLDLSVIPLIKQKTHLPIIIDPSHATGDYSLVEPMCLAAIAAGADGLIVEVHDHPECALSDGSQSLKPKKFEAMVVKAREIAHVVGREIL